MIFHYAYTLCTLLITVKGWKSKNYYENFEEINKFEVSLVNQCYNQINGPAAAFGNWKINEPSYLLEFEQKDLKTCLSHKERFFKLRKNDQVPLPSTKFFIETLSLESLKITLKVLKDSLHWNLHGFYVVKNTPMFNTCKLAYSIFKTFWDFKVLNVVYLCHDISDGFSLYTYNPFNDVAPKIWKYAGKILEENEHPFTLFKILDNNTDILTICKGLNYDKTRNISKYPIKVAEPSYIFKVLNPPNNIETDVFTETRIFMRIILKKMRAKIVAKQIHETEVGFVYENGSFVGTLKQIFEGTIDICSFLEWQKGWQYEVYVQLNEGGICYAIKKNPSSLFENVIVIFPPKILVMLICFLLLAIIIFAYILQLDYVSITLDVLRATLGTTTLHYPSTTLRNLVFIWLIYSSILINVYLQSQLSANLVSSAKTKSAHLNSYEDLADNKNLKIYSRDYIKQYYANTKLFEKIIPEKNMDDCFKSVDKDANIVCIHPCQMIRYDLAESSKLQIFQDKLLSNLMVLFFREDLPFIRKFQHLSHRLAENGIVYHLYSITKSYYYRHPPEESTFQITIYQMEGQFFFLIAMYFISFLVFLIELTMNLKSKILKF